MVAAWAIIGATLAPYVGEITSASTYSDHHCGPHPAWWTQTPGHFFHGGGSKINNRAAGLKRRRTDMEASSKIDLNQTNGSGNHNQGPANTTSSAAPAAAAATGASINLVRRNQNIIWVRIGLTDHPAFELYNPDNPDNNGSTVWVQMLCKATIQFCHNCCVYCCCYCRKTSLTIAMDV